MDGGGIGVNGNLRPALTSDEARERGRRGGIASGVARRKRVSLRNDLIALLEADDGVVAKSIAVAICSEAKRGNVGAYRAIAQVLGELKEEGEKPDLPPPFIIEVHDPAYIEAERKRQAAAMAETVEVFAAEPLAIPERTEATGGADGAGSPKAGIRDAGNAPDPAVGTERPQERGAIVGPLDAPSAEAEAEAWGRPPGLPAETQPPQAQPPRTDRPRTPSEAAAIRRAQEAKNQAASSSPHGSERTSAVPAAFPRRYQVEKGASVISHYKDAGRVARYGIR